jgi:hypothetical protein
MGHDKMSRPPSATRARAISDASVPVTRLQPRIRTRPTPEAISAAASAPTTIAAWAECTATNIHASWASASPAPMAAEADARNQERIASGANVARASRWWSKG